MVRHIPGESKRLEQIISRLGSVEVQVGFFEHSRYEDGTPVAYVATIQEKGAIQRGIPPRPFFQPAVTEGEKGNRQVIAQAVRNAFRGDELATGFELLGGKVVGDIQKKISEVATPPLKPATIAARARRHSQGLASTKPLVDTGQMLAAVTYKVEGA